MILKDERRMICLLVMANRISSINPLDRGEIVIHIAGTVERFTTTRKLRKRLRELTAGKQ